MDTSKYTQSARKEAKRATRHPAYRALRERYGVALAEANKLRADLRAREGDVAQLTNEVGSLKAKIAAAA